MVKKTCPNDNLYPCSTTTDDSSVTFNTYSANMEIQYANNYHAQNEMLRKFKDQQSTRDSKSAYLKQQTYSLNWYNWLFLWVYVAIGLLFIIRGLGLNIAYLSPGTTHLVVQSTLNCH